MRFSQLYIDKLFSSDADPTDCVGQILNVASCNPKLDKEFYDGIGHPLCNLHFFTYYTAELSNGGHYQFYFNLEEGGYEFVFDALTDLGMLELKAVLTQSASVFKLNKPPIDIQSRRSVLNSLKSPALQLLNSCDMVYYDDLMDRCEVKAKAYMHQERDWIIDFLKFD